MKRHLLAVTAVSGLAFFVATPAYALCSTNTPVNNAVVNCSLIGGATDGFGVQGNGSSEGIS